MQKYLIRECLPEDSANFNAYLKKITNETEYLLTSPDEVSNSLEQHENFIKKCLDADNYLCLIAEYKGEIVGNLVFRGGEKKKNKHFGDFGVTVVKNHWGNGLASKFITAMLEWAEKSSIIKKINLKAREDNERAITLYQRFGFKKEGKIRNFFHDNGEFYDAITMGIVINEDFDYKLSFDKNIDLIALRDFYCSYSTWKVPMLTTAWEEIIDNSQVLLTIWDETNLIASGRALSDKVRWATIVDILVHPNYRNKGIGTKLMKSLLARQELKVRSISLSTDGADGFYEKIGFTNVNKCCSHMIKINMELEDSFILPV